MNRLIPAAISAAFLLASGGIALAADQAPQSGTTTPMQHGMAMHGGAANGQNPLGDRMTHALNILEANGYGGFSNFHQQGNGFAATVTKNGNPVQVSVNPDTNQVTPEG